MGLGARRVKVAWWLQQELWPVSSQGILFLSFPVSVFVLGLHREELGPEPASLAFLHNPLIVCSEPSLALNSGGRDGEGENAIS